MDVNLEEVLVALVPTVSTLLLVDLAVLAKLFILVFPVLMPDVNPVESSISFAVTTPAETTVLTSFYNL